MATANEWSAYIGLREVPTIEAKTIGKVRRSMTSSNGARAGGGTCTTALALRASDRRGWPPLLSPLQSGTSSSGVGLPFRVCLLSFLIPLFALICFPGARRCCLLVLFLCCPDGSEGHARPAHRAEPAGRRRRRPRRGWPRRRPAAGRRRPRRIRRRRTGARRVQRGTGETAERAILIRENPALSRPFPSLPLFIRPLMARRARRALIVAGCSVVRFFHPRQTRSRPIKSLKRL